METSMMGYGAGLGLGFGLGGPLTLLGCGLVVVGLVMLAAWLIGRAEQGQHPQRVVPSAAAEQPDAADILRMRLARGEITVEDYAAAKQALEASR
jgi:uncharacterized membrane protein